MRITKDKWDEHSTDYNLTVLCKPDKTFLLPESGPEELDLPECLAWCPSEKPMPPNDTGLVISEGDNNLDEYWEGDPLTYLCKDGELGTDASEHSFKTYKCKRDVPKGRYNTPRPELKENQLWRLAITPTGIKLVNKKFPKWRLKDENSGAILEAEIESWAVPPEGAKGFLEQILESNLTGRVLGVKGASDEPESPVELQEKIEMITNVNLTLEEKDTFDSQMWVRGKKDSDDYFSLQNPVSELFLTVESPTETWIADQGLSEPWPICMPKTTTVKPEIKFGLRNLLKTFNTELVKNKTAEQYLFNRDAGDRNYVLEVMVPTLLLVGVLIMGCLCCTRNDNPICKICGYTVEK